MANADKTPEPTPPTEEAPTSAEPGAEVPVQVEVSPGVPEPAYATGGRRGYDQETGAFHV